MSMPDGKPVALVGRWRAGSHVAQVAGPDFMPVFLQSSNDLRHFFLGGTQETLERLVEWVGSQFPGVKIAGAISPSFRVPDDRESRELISRIKTTRPDVIWIGLGAPKQELWMAQHCEALSPAVLMGVGAAFDFLAGTKARVPRWMQHFGLEWLFRLCQEPRRLTGRYLRTNSLFLLLLLKDIFKSVYSNQTKIR
jgi:N-acetylglucosaminyldiphosphoundecaprenol N-acetyl-beta-D-mannosaminyltransferase